MFAGAPFVQLRGWSDVELIIQRASQWRLKSTRGEAQESSLMTSKRGRYRMHQGSQLAHLMGSSFFDASLHSVEVAPTMAATPDASALVKRCSVPYNDTSLYSPCRTHESPSLADMGDTPQSWLSVSAAGTCECQRCCASRYCDPPSSSPLKNADAPTGGRSVVSSQIFSKTLTWYFEDTPSITQKVFGCCASHSMTS